MVFLEIQNNSSKICYFTIWITYLFLLKSLQDKNVKILFHYWHFYIYQQRVEDSFVCNNIQTSKNAEKSIKRRFLTKDVWNEMELQKIGRLKSDLKPFGKQDPLWYCFNDCTNCQVSAKKLKNN